jgi:hypothetical protein
LLQKAPKLKSLIVLPENATALLRIGEHLKVLLFFVLFKDFAMVEPGLIQFAIQAGGTCSLCIIQGHILLYYYNQESAANYSNLAREIEL